MDKSESSYLDKAPKVILVLILTFTILALTSKDEAATNLLQGNITHITLEDSDGDGIKNSMDPCIQSDSQIADADKDGCPDVYGRIKEAYHELDQINPTCTNKSCRELIQKITQPKHSLRPLLNTQYWKTANMTKCATPDVEKALTSVRAKIIKICPGYEECDVIEDTLVDVIRNIQIAKREHTKQECK